MKRDITAIGIDIAKRVFHVIGMDTWGTIILRKRLYRGEVMGSVAKFDLGGKIQKSSIRNSMSYRFPNSRKSNFATESHRGHCVLFEHETLGELGKLVIMNIHEGKMVLQAELCKGQDSEESPLIKQKKHVFEQFVATVNNCFDENLPEGIVNLTADTRFPEIFLDRHVSKYKELADR